MGQSLTLAMTVTADPCPEVEWRLDGRTLAEVEEESVYDINSCSDFTGPDTGSYTFTIAINSVSDSTTGNYTITLSNRAGTVTSDPVFVTPEGVCADHSVYYCMLTILFSFYVYSASTSRGGGDPKLTEMSICGPSPNNQLSAAGLPLSRDHLQ